ncbi:MAG TPA: esterase-like activity of phytase family protein [Sphingomonas sp.]|nr:esterase-like activity of phytase family protein [Sphingomonas sp.]
MRATLAALLVCSVALPTHAGVILLAQGTLTGSSAGANTDLSGLTGLLEDGLPASMLGGVGSGLAYAGGNTFIGVPDRGPNVEPYSAAVDNTVTFISRLQTMTMALTNVPDGSLPFTLTPTLTKTTLLWSSTPLTYGSGAGLVNDVNGQSIGSGAPAQNGAGVYYFTGRSDNFGAGDSGNPLNGRFDPEGVRVSSDGKSVFVSDEYGPYVRQFDRKTGELIKTFDLPDNLDAAHLSPRGDLEISGNSSGRVANKGMEGLALTPDGKTLVGVMQAPLIQDAAIAKTASMIRIVTIDIATGETKQYGYNLTTGSGVSEIVAINNHEFLLDERDGKGLGDGSNAKVKQLFKIDIAGAIDITALSGDAAADAVVGKKATPFLDIVAALKAFGLTAAQIPAKIEGLSFGQDVTTADGKLLHTLYVSNDNDFMPGMAGPNKFYVFGFEDGDLPGFLAQRIAAVPEPASWAMMIGGFGLIGAAMRRDRRRVAVAFGR